MPAAVLEAWRDEGAPQRLRNRFVTGEGGCSAGRLVVELLLVCLQFGLCAGRVVQLASWRCWWPSSFQPSMTCLFAVAWLPHLPHTPDPSPHAPVPRR